MTTEWTVVLAGAKTGRQTPGKSAKDVQSEWRRIAAGVLGRPGTAEPMIAPRRYGTISPWRMA